MHCSHEVIIFFSTGLFSSVQVFSIKAPFYQAPIIKLILLIAFEFVLILKHIFSLPQWIFYKMASFYVFLADFQCWWIILSSLTTFFLYPAVSLVFQDWVFFSIQVFQGLSPGSGSMFYKKPNVSVYIFLSWRKNVKIKTKFTKFIKYITKLQLNRC